MGLAFFPGGKMILAQLLLLAVPVEPASLCGMTRLPDDVADSDPTPAQLNEILEAHDDCAPAHYLLGLNVLHSREGRDIDAAISHLERATKAFPSSSWARTWLGQAYLARAGEESSLSDAHTGRDLLLEAIKLDPDNVGARTTVSAFFRQAPWIAGGDIDAAYAQAAEIRKRDLRLGLLEQARAFAADDEPEKAVNLLRTSLESFPDYTPMVLEYAMTLQQTDEFKEAHRVLMRATQEGDSDAVLLYQLGRVAARSGDFIADGRKALQRYLEFAETESDLPLPAKAAWWRLGQIEQHDGHSDLARDAFEQALKLDPDFKEAAESLAELVDQ